MFRFLQTLTKLIIKKSLSFALIHVFIKRRKIILIIMRIYISVALQTIA